MSGRLFEVAKNVTLLAVSLVVALVFGETVARIWIKVQPYEHVANEGSPHWNVDHPTRRYALSPGYIGRLRAVEYDTLVTTNALGHRIDAKTTLGEAPLERDPQGVAPLVLAVGDSFTFGVGVEAEESIPSRLADHLSARSRTRRAEVWNLGVPGYAIQPSILHLEEVLDHLAALPSGPRDPAAAVLFVYLGSRASGANDISGAVVFDRWARAASAQAPTQTELANQGARHNPPATASHRARKKRLSLRGLQRTAERRSALYNALMLAIAPRLRAWKQGREVPGTSEAEKMEAGWILADSWLARFAQRAAIDGFVPLVVAVPELPDLLRKEDTPIRRLEALAALHELPFLDGSASLTATGDPAGLYFPLDGHLTAEGYDLMAQASARALESELAKEGF